MDIILFFKLKAILFIVYSLNALIIRKYLFVLVLNLFFINLVIVRVLRIFVNVCIIIMMV